MSSYTKEKSLAFSGHRSEKLPQTPQEMDTLLGRTSAEIDRAIKAGYDTFIMGACYGFDLLAAGLVLEKKKLVPFDNPVKLRLIAAVPYEEQAAEWSEANRDIYYDTLALCDEVETLNTRYRRGCFHERNRWMVDRASRLICYHDGSASGTGYTILYAQKKGLEIVNLYEAAAK